MKCVQTVFEKLKESKDLNKLLTRKIVCISQKLTPKDHAKSESDEEKPSQMETDTTSKKVYRCIELL